MSCQQIAELLPWYLNGALDTADRDEVERHLETCAACRKEMSETRDALLLFGGHPSVEALVEHAAGGGGRARELVEAHLADCQSCVEELAMALDSRRAMDAAVAPAAESIASAAASPATARVVPLRRPAPPPPAWRAAAVAAALIGLIGVAGGLWSWQALERERDTFAQDRRAAEDRIAELEAQRGTAPVARANVPIHDLWPDGSVMRSAGSEPAALPSGDGPAATLILNTQLDSGAEIERLEIRDASGAVLQRLERLRVTPSGSFTLSLELGRLPRGPVRILLFTSPAGDPVESYSFELE